MRARSGELAAAESEAVAAAVRAAAVGGGAGSADEEDADEYACWPACALGRDEDRPAGGGGMGKLSGAAASELGAGRVFIFEKLLKASSEEKEAVDEAPFEVEGWWLAMCTDDGGEDAGGGGRDESAADAAVAIGRHGGGGRRKERSRIQYEA